MTSENFSENTTSDEAPDIESKTTLPLANRYLLGLITISSIFGVLYWILNRVEGLTSISMFVGIPLVLGWIVGMMHLKNPIAAAAQYTTLVLCVIAPIVGEGVICIIMAAPIVYPIVIVIAALASSTRKQSGGKFGAALILTPFIWGIVQPQFPLSVRTESIHNSIVISAPPAFVWQSLEKLDLELTDNRPGFLRLGYPVPQKIVSLGMKLGDKRQIVFNNGTILGTVQDVDPEKYMALSLAIENSHGEFFDRWVDLKEMHFTLIPIGLKHTLLIHSATYKPKLALRWYFGPLERFTSSLLEDYLLNEFGKNVAGAYHHVAVF